MASSGYTVDQLEAWGWTLLATIDSQLMSVGHILQLRRKIESELSFLKRVKLEKSVEYELKSTNLTHLCGVVDYLKEADGYVETLKVFRSNAESGREVSVVVDVVTGSGSEWRKMIARNPSALYREWRGHTDSHQRTLVDQARDYILVARDHPINFRTPKIYFHFLSGVKMKMAVYLEKRGIGIVGERLKDDDIDDDDDNEDSDYLDDDDDNEELLKDDAIDENCDDIVNLDLTACIAYISAVSNGRCGFRFKDPVLTEQADRERIQPVLPVLREFMKDKDLIMCQTAHRELMKIVDTIGGVEERHRLEELMCRVRIVEDCMSERTRRLPAHRKLKERSCLIFGTGDALRAVTLTANRGFVQAAREQGVEFSVFIHEPRALTELKELTASPVPYEDS